MIDIAMNTNIEFSGTYYTICSHFSKVDVQNIKILRENLTMVYLKPENCLRGNAEAIQALKFDDYSPSISTRILKTIFPLFIIIQHAGQY